MQRLGLRLAVLSIVLALALAAASWLLDEEALRWLALFLALPALALLLAPLLPGFGQEPPFQPRIPRGFSLVEHRSVRYPKAPEVHGYEVRFRPTRTIRGVHWKATADAPLLHARVSFERVIRGELQGAWAVDAERLEGTSAVLSFSRPTLDPSFDLWVQVDAKAPVRILRIQRAEGLPATIEPEDLMPNCTRVARSRHH